MGATITDLAIELKMKNSRIENLKSKYLKNISKKINFINGYYS